MTVNEPGHHDAVLAGQRLHGGVIRFDLGRRPDGHNDAFVDRHGAVLDDRHRGVHRDDVVTLDDEVDPVRIGLRDCRRCRGAPGFARRRQKCQENN